MPLQKDFLRSAATRAMENIAPELIQKYPLIKRALNMQYQAVRFLDEEIYTEGQNRILEILDAHVDCATPREKEEVMAAAILFTGDTEKMDARSVRHKLGNNVLNTIEARETDPQSYQHYVQISAAMVIWQMEDMIDRMLSGNTALREAFCEKISENGPINQLNREFFTNNLGASSLNTLYKDMERTINMIAVFPQEKTKKQLSLVN